MAYKVVLIDTSILIDCYRRTDKANSIWVSLMFATLNRKHFDRIDELLIVE